MCIRAAQGSVYIVVRVYGAISNVYIFSSFSLILVLSPIKMAKSSRCMLVFLLFGI